MVTVYFTSIVKKESINNHFTSQRSNNQYNKGSFIPCATFSSQNTHFEFKFIRLMQAFFLHGIKYYKYQILNIINRLKKPRMCWG